MSTVLNNSVVLERNKSEIITYLEEITGHTISVRKLTGSMRGYVRFLPRKKKNSDVFYFNRDMSTEIMNKYNDGHDFSLFVTNCFDLTMRNVNMDK